MTDLDVSFWLLNADGSYRCALPDWKTYALSPIVHEPGAAKIEYPVNGRNFAALREHADNETDAELAVWIAGRDDGDRVLLNADDSDDVADDAVWTFSGNFGEVRLEEAVIADRTTVVTPPSGDPPTEDLAAFRVYSATAGTIMRALLQEANDRGTLTDVDWSTFTNTTDSNGVAWSQVITLKIAPGTTYLAVAQSLVEYGLCEFRMIGRSLRMFEPGTMGVDRTLGPAPLVLRRGRDLRDSPRKRDVRKAATDLLLAGGEGVYGTVFDATARARRGRQIEQYRSQGGITDQGSLLAYGGVELQRTTHGTLSVTHGLDLSNPATPIPLVHFRPGDWVWSDTGQPAGMERLQVAQVTIQGDADGSRQGSAGLNDLIASREAQLARRLKGIEGGSTVTGTSQARPVDDGPDTTPPAAPQGLAATSIAYQDTDGATRASITATWGEVTTNADGTAIDDLDVYTPRYRYLSAGTLPADWYVMSPVTDTAASWGNVVAGAAVEVQVSATDRSGNVSAWSTGYTLTTEDDTTPPPVPAAPSATPYLGQVRVDWNGLGSAGEAMPGDLAYVEVHRSTTTGFTPDSSTLFDRLARGTLSTIWSPADGDDSYGVAQFFRLVAVDRTGNRSDPSAEASATPRAIGYADIAFSDVGNLVEDGSFELPGSRARHQARSDAAWSFVQGGADADHGQWFARADATVGSGSRDLVLSDRVPTLEGRQYAYRFALRGNSPDGDITAAIAYYDKAGAQLPSLILNFTPADATGEWVGKEIPQYVTPAGAETMQVIMRLSSNCTAGSWDIDRVELREMIGTLLVQNAAITNAKIADLDVGKLTSGQLNAIIALVGELRTADPPNARVIINASGVEKYDENDVLRVQITDTETFLDGKLVTGRTGESRIAIGTGSYGRNYMVAETDIGATVVVGQVYNQADNTPLANGLLVQRSSDTLDLFVCYGETDNADLMKVGTLIYRPEDGKVVLAAQEGADNTLGLYSPGGAHQTVVTPGAAALHGPDGNSSILLNNANVYYEGQHVGAGIWGKIYVKENYCFIGGAAASNANGFEYTGTDNGGYLSLRTPEFVQVVDSFSSSFREIRASAFTQSSAARTKSDVQPLPGPALDVLRGAPVARWRRADDTTGIEQIGPMADDLPSWAVLPADGPGVQNTTRVVETVDEDGQPTREVVVDTEPGGMPDSERIDLGSMVGLLWDAVRELDSELDEYRTQHGKPAPVRRSVDALLADIRAGRLTGPKRRKDGPA